MSADAPRAIAVIEREHRHLDDLLGRCLSILGSHDPAPAASALELFDGELRRHTAAEDEYLLARSPDGKLAPEADESELARLRRELALEHVQLRELSGILLRLLTEQRDLEGARSLFPSLLRRWEAHTSREERAFVDLVPGATDLGAFFPPA